MPGLPFRDHFSSENRLTSRDQSGHQPNGLYYALCGWWRSSGPKRLSIGCGFRLLDAIASHCATKCCCQIRKLFPCSLRVRAIESKKQQLLIAKKLKTEHWALSTEKRPKATFKAVLTDWHAMRLRTLLFWFTCKALKFCNSNSPLKHWLSSAFVIHQRGSSAKLWWKNQQ